MLQVHITQGDDVGRSMIISWVTPLHHTPNAVTYWEADAGAGRRHTHKRRARAVTTTYRYYNYTSGFLHHATVPRLKVKRWIVNVMNDE